MDASSRFINVMKNISKNNSFIPSLIVLKVQSTSPLILTDGEKLFLTEDFLVFSNHLDLEQIEIGDTFRAIILNSNQTYYITEVLSSTNIVDKYLQ